MRELIKEFREFLFFPFYYFGAIIGVLWYIVLIGFILAILGTVVSLIGKT